MGDARRDGDIVLMASKSSRNRRRKSRRYKPQNERVDQHAEAALSSMFDTVELLANVLQATDPQVEVDNRIDDAAEQLVAGVAGYDPLGTLEAIRMMTLPFAPAGGMPSAGTQSGPAVCEILAVALLCAASDVDTDQNAKRVDQDLCGVISERLIPIAHDLLNLATVRDLLATDAADAMAQVSASVRGNGRWLRGTSYPEMHDATLKGLFGESEVDAGIRSVLGFGVEDALSFLNGCHQMQTEQLNERGQGLASAFNEMT